ncbi:MAG: DUF1127 domain-containing protein [Pseudomonadota bacterium]
MAASTHIGRRTSLSTHSATPTDRHLGLVRRAKAVLHRAQEILAVAHERKHLGQLDDRTLADIGVTRAQADFEAQRPFWEAPTRR